MVRVECLWTPCESTGKIILTIMVGVSIKYNLLDAQNKTNMTTRYMTFCITIPLFIIMKILMPIIHYDANIINSWSQSIHLYYNRHLRSWSNNQYNVLRE